MVRILGWVICLWTLSGIASAQSLKVAGGLSAEELSLLQEFRTSYERLKDFYGNCSIEATNLNRGLRADKPTETSERTYAYYSNGSRLFRLEKHSEGRLVIWVAGPEMHFLARADNGPLVLTKQFSTREEVINELTSEKFQWSPYSFYVFPLARVIGERFVYTPNHRSDDWHIKSAVPTNENGQRRVTVTCEGNFTVGGDLQLKRGTFIFLRDLTWALKEYSFGVVNLQNESDRVQKAEYEYSEDHDGIPLLKRVVYWSEYGPEKTKLAVEEFNITKFIPGAVDQREFLPSALDLAVGRTEAMWWPRILILVVGIALIVAYTMLKRRATTL